MSIVLQVFSHKPKQNVYLMVELDEKTSIFEDVDSVGDMCETLL